MGKFLMSNAYIFRNNMSRFFILVIIFTLYNNSFACSIYHSYEQEMIHTLTELLGDRNSVPIRELLTDKDLDAQKSIIDDSINGKNMGIFNDAIIFLKISNLLNPLSQWPESYTRNDVETMSQWWERNDIAIDSDFLADVLWYDKTLSRFEFMLPVFEKYGNKLRERLNDRIINRHSKLIFCDDENDTIEDVSTTNNLKEFLNIQQKKLQELFNNDNMYIESIIPFQEMKFYVYISKKLMYNEEYNMSTPVSRKEFEDMEDWWFVNSCEVSDSTIHNIFNEYDKKLYGISN